MKQSRYPGVRPFETADKSLYFGRERDCADLTGLIGLEKLVVLFGKSGYGKSSLINAGVIPLLESKGNIAFPIRFGTYSDGQESLLAILLNRLDNDNRIAVNPDMEFLDSICPEKTLWYYAKRRQQKNSCWVFFFDQFEEYFLHPAVIRRNFEEQLAELLYTNVPQVVLNNSHRCNDNDLALLLQPIDVRVVFSIRADHLSDLDGMKTRLPSILLKRYELKALKRDQAQDGIVKPARLIGDYLSPPFEYRDEAIEKILDGLSTPEGGIEAFQLQILCDFIDNKVVKGEVPDRDNNGLPDVEINDLPPLEQVLGEYYKRKMNTLPPEKNEAASYIIEEKLIFENKQTGEARRVSIDKDQLLQDAAPHGADEPLLDQLENTFLVRRLSNSTGGFNYEISHDTLVAPVRKAKKERLLAERQKAELHEKEQLLLVEQKKRRRRLMLSIFSFVLFPFLFFVYFLINKNKMEKSKEKNEIGRIVNNINDLIKFAKSNNELAIIQAKEDPTLALQLEKQALDSLEKANILIVALNKSYKDKVDKNLNLEYQLRRSQIKTQINSVIEKDDALYKIVEKQNQEPAIFNIAFINGIFPDISNELEFKVWHADKKTIDTILNHGHLIEVVFPEINEAMALYKEDSSKNQYNHTHFWGTKSYYRELKKDKNDKITSIAAIRYAVIGYKMLSALNNKRIVEWNLNGTIRRSSNRPVIYTKDTQFDDSIVSIAISKDRAKIFTASDKGMGNIWAADTSNVANPLKPTDKRAFNTFQKNILCSAFSNDGKMIATGSMDNTISIWTADNGNLIKVLNGHKGPITSVAFSAKDNFVYSGSMDSTFRQWRVQKDPHVSWNKTKSFDSLFIDKIIESITPKKNKNP